MIPEEAEYTVEEFDTLVLPYQLALVVICLPNNTDEECAFLLIRGVAEEIAEGVFGHNPCKISYPCHAWQTIQPAEKSLQRFPRCFRSHFLYALTIGWRSLSICFQTALRSLVVVFFVILFSFLRGEKFTGAQFLIIAKTNEARTSIICYHIVLMDILAMPAHAEGEGGRLWVLHTLNRSGW